MEEKKREVSFLVFVGFLLLFLIFFFLGPSDKSSGNVVIGSITLGENPSIVTLIVLFIILVVVLAAVFLVFKKFKKKKVHVESPTQEDKKLGFEKNKEDKKESKLELDDREIEKLFSGDGETKKEPPKVEPVNDKLVDKIQQPEKKVLTNLQDLKNKIKGMLSQNFNREQIIGNLKLQGITIDQITKAIEDVNLDNIRGYVTQTLNQGFTKDQIIRNLAAHGWKKEQISKVI